MLTAHWTFAPGDVDGRAVRDDLGSGLVMTLDERVELVPGPEGVAAVAFDGTARATVPAAPQLVLNQLFGFAIAFHLLPGEGPTGEWRGVLYKPVGEHDARALGVWLQPESMRLRAQLFTATGGPEYADSARELPVGDWTHVAVTVDTDGLQLYLNGVRDVGVPLDHPVITTGGTTFLGRDPTGLGFTGALADLRFYGEAVGPETVAALVG